MTHVRWVATCWYLLAVNVLGFIGQPLIPIPKAGGQLVTMGALCVALVVALAHNPRIEIRPNALLGVISLLILCATASSLRMEAGPGALVRCGRAWVFLVVLWLLSPYWRDGMQFVRYHIHAFGAFVAIALAGLVVAPGRARPGGRLGGTLWPMAPPQVAQWAAVVTGLTLILWVGKLVGTRTVLWVAPAMVFALLLTKTRTALLGLVVGVAVALLSHFLVSLRARRLMAWSVVTGAVGALLFAPIIVSFLTRGQNAEALASLTGRAAVWQRLLAQPRDRADHWLGIGYSDKGYGGLPIDSTWLSAYHEQGLIGASLVALALATVLFGAAVRPPSTGRACAVFLIAYVLVASYTEVGLGDVNAYLLHLVVAAAALHGADVQQARERVGADRPVERGG